MNAPIITSIEDLKTGTDVRINLTNPVEAVSLIVMYQDLTSSGFTESAQALSSQVDIEMPLSRFYAFVVVAVDADGNYSLPSNLVRCLPTDGDGSVERRIEKEIIATLETITATNGYFDTVDKVYRVSYRIDAELEDDFFLLVAFDTVDHEFAAHYGTDVIDTQTMNVVVAACHKGRSTDEDWIPDTVDDMFTAIQAAIFEDRSRSGLALDTTPLMDDMRPSELQGVTDAVCTKTFSVEFRTLREDTHANATCGN